MNNKWVFAFILFTNVVANAQEPTQQAAQVQVDNVNASQVVISFTAGNGTGRIVVMSLLSDAITPPSDFQEYAASTTFGQGQTTGGQSFVVYKGTGTNATITGLTQGTPYRVHVFEETNGDFNTSSSTNNPVAIITTPSAPTAESSNLVVTGVSPTEISLQWTSGAGTGARRLVLARAGNPVSATPINNVLYAVDPNFGSGAMLMGGGPTEQNFATFFNSGTSLAVMNLTPETTYHFRLFEANVNGGTGPIINQNVTYMTTGPVISKKTLAVEPGTHATNIDITDKTSTTLDLTWTRGDGTGVLVVASEGTSSPTSPLDGTTPAANSKFGDGENVGNGSYVVYVGNGNTVTISNLKPNTKYSFKALEFTGTAETTNYKIITAMGMPANNPSTFNTTTEPITQASTIDFSDITNDEMKLQWSSGSGERRIVVCRLGNAVTANPSDGVNYTASDVFGNGDDLGDGNFVVYDGTSNSVTVSNLQPSTTYAFKVFEYNNSIEVNYNPASASGNPVTRSTVGTEPGNPPSNAVLTSRSTSSLSFSFVGSIGGADGYVVVRRTGSSVTAIPADGFTYSAGQSIADGETIVYSGSDLAFSDNSLASNTTFFYKIYSYNGSGGIINYNSTPLSFNGKTIASEPGSGAKDFSSKNLTTTSFDIEFAAQGVDPDGYLVVRRTGAAPTGSPADETSYNENDPLGDGVIIYVGDSPKFSQAGLSPNTEYYYKVFAFNGENTESNYLASMPLGGKVTTFPNEPVNQASNHVLTGKTTQSLSFSFDPAVGGAAGYVVLRNSGSSVTAMPVDGTPYSEGEEISGNYVAYVGTGTSYTDNSITSGTMHHYKVFAFNGTGTTINYNTASPLMFAARTFFPEPSAQPSGFSTSNITETSFNIHYALPNATPDGVLILRKQGSSPTDSPVDGTTYAVGNTIGDGVVVYAGADISVSQSSLVANTEYHYKIFAYNGDNSEINYRTSDAHEGHGTTLPLEPVNQPSSVNFTSITATSFNVNFAAAAGGADGYVVLRKQGEAITAAPVDGVSYTSDSNLGDSKIVYVGTSTTILQEQLTAATEYRYMVFAYNVNNGGPNYNTTVNGNHAIALTVPAASTAVDASTITQNSLLARWNSVQGATHYLVDVSKDNFSTLLSDFSGKSVSGTSTTVGNLESGVTYSYRVRAVNASGASVFSNVVSQITIPATPTLNPAVDVKEKSFTISWNAVIGASNYFVDVSTDGFASKLSEYDNLSVGGVSLTLNVEGGLIYQFRVRSNNSAGTSPSSTALNQKTISKAPVALDAINVNATSFGAKWNQSVGADSYELDVATDAAFSMLLSGYPVRDISKEATTLIVSNLTPTTSYWYRLRAVNGAGISANSSSIPVRTSEGGGIQQLTISLASTNVSSTTNNEPVPLAATVSGGVDPKVVKFYSKKMSGDSFNEVTLTTHQNFTYSYNAPSALFDAIGLEYYFAVTDNSGTKRETEKKTIFKLIDNNSSPVPVQNLGVGGGRDDYRMFSIPHKIVNNSIDAVFAEYGGYDISKWRLVHYQNGEYIEPGRGLSIIEQGKAYWFNATSNKEINLHDTQVPAYSSTVPARIRLEVGWNQIGNPYPINVDWNAVLEANKNVVLGGLRVYDPATHSFQDSNILPAWSGGFVSNDGDEVITIDIPISSMIESGRLSKRTPNSRIDEDEWFVPIEISQGAVMNGLSGIGMSPEASDDFDNLDETTLPRFMRFLEMNSYVQSKRGQKKLTRTIARTAENFTWDLVIESDNYENGIQLSWDPTSFGENNASLVLHDLATDAIVDMKTVGTFKVSSRGPRRIKIYFSRIEPAVPESTILGAAYPNPMLSTTTIPVLVSEDSRRVHIQILNMQGVVVRNITTTFERGGFHEIHWDGMGDAGQKISSGNYLYRQVGSGSRASSIKKLLVY